MLRSTKIPPAVRRTARMTEQRRGPTEDAGHESRPEYPPAIAKFSRLATPAITAAHTLSRTPATRRARHPDRRAAGLNASPSRPAIAARYFFHRAIVPASLKTEPLQPRQTSRPAPHQN